MLSPTTIILSMSPTSFDYIYSVLCSSITVTCRSGFASSTDGLTSFIHLHSLLFNRERVVLCHSNHGSFEAIDMTSSISFSSSYPCLLLHFTDSIVYHDGGLTLNGDQSGHSLVIWLCPFVFSVTSRVFTLERQQ